MEVQDLTNIEEAKQWFREAQFGLFVHWGLYAIPAGIWNGQPNPWLGEWIMHTARIPVREYETLAKDFNPTRFDAREWVQLAEAAGMKYIVFTAKHHEGFAMNESWGYKLHGGRWKTGEELLHLRRQAQDRGCNLLLNVGPMADGRFPPEAVERLQYLARYSDASG